MFQEIFGAFMAGWGAAILTGVIGGWIWWLCLTWEREKVRQLELEKIIHSAKCELKKREEEEKKWQREKKIS